MRLLTSDVHCDQGEHTCVVCEQEGDDLVVCVGLCISTFHVKCLPVDSGDAEAQNEAWLCPNCKTKTHACFHCKQTSMEMLASDTSATMGSELTKRPVRKCRALLCGHMFPIRSWLWWRIRDYLRLFRSSSFLRLRGREGGQSVQYLVHRALMLS